MHKKTNICLFCITTDDLNNGLHFQDDFQGTDSTETIEYGIYRAPEITPFQQIKSILKLDEINSSVLVDCYFNIL